MICLLAYLLESLLIISTALALVSIFVITINERKYEFAEKMLFLIPHPMSSLASRAVDELSQTNSPEQIIDYFNNHILSQKDLHTDKHIASSNIIAVNLQTQNMHILNRNGEPIEITPEHTSQK